MERETVDEMFYRLFDRKEFYGNGDFEHYSKLADKWWLENHIETEEDYNFRIENFQRPVMGGIIYVQ